MKTVDGKTKGMLTFVGKFCSLHFPFSRCFCLTKEDSKGKNHLVASGCAIVSVLATENALDAQLAFGATWQCRRSSCCDM